MSSDRSGRHHHVPVSLGKPSLRLRLEAYYKLIAPDQIKGPEWRSRFDQIWTKFGGSEDGEYKLSLRLRKKYGDAVRLEIVTSKQADEQKIDQHPNPEDTLNEEDFNLKSTEKDSGIIDFKSNCFDPVATLKSNLSVVSATNPIVNDCPMLDRVSLCEGLLPKSDPLYRQSRKRKAPAVSAKPKDDQPKGTFAAIVQPHATGPLSILFEAMRKKQRVRIVTRYIDCIRGTLTGHILAFDKHCNVILRDATEVYSRRCPNTDYSMSNLEMELQRRQSGHAQGNTDASTNEWSVRQRRLPQTMIRGDCVVTIYLAKSERSAWPKTSLSPDCRYQSTVKTVPPNERVGTPGSLSLVLKRTDRYDTSSSSHVAE